MSKFLSENPENIMVIIGFGGQALFAARFLIQWITSESVKKSVIPVAFWYFSISGGIVLLTYAIWRKDPVIIFPACIPTAVVSVFIIKAILDMYHCLPHGCIRGSHAQTGGQHESIHFNAHLNSFEYLKRCQTFH